jgi:hypothetical protein
MTTNTGINSIEIFDNGNKYSRITVTQNNDVRIKIGKDVNPEDDDTVIHILTEAARAIIVNGYNANGTLRGTYKVAQNKDNSVLIVATNHKIKKNRTKFRIDLQLHTMLEK